ncbi:MAG: SDR family NAD(P)-dependent oxidoreductase [Candidatus Pararuminococcus gallinarum]|uniref:SDR family NAD(P)-dependent oxidoreductase n=1 Tax=Zongyangia sp. HA2173 TaxID=3133035 RepID=UPI003161A4F3
MDAPQGKFSGKIAVVTGSSFGIGRAIALELAAEGATVVVTGRNEARVGETVQMIEDAGGKAIGRCFDIKEKSEIDAFFQFVKELGGVDIFVSNAGVTKVCRFLENTEEDLENILRTNFMGAVYCVQAAGRLMRDQKRGGNILLVTSVNAYHPLPTQSFYSSLKAGLEALCKALAYEFYPYGIRFNCVAPGATLTGMSKDMTEEDFSNLNQTVPLGRIGYPEDMAKAVSFMVSEDASYITGASLIVDGGLCLRKDV